jgi:hypothetical protein
MTDGRYADAVTLEIDNGYLNFVAGGNAGYSGPSSGAWHHVVGTWDVNAEATYLYVDGAQMAYTNNGGVGPTPAPYYPITFKDNYCLDPNTHFDGLIDEMRVSNLARSADWILAEYNNQNAPGNIGYRKKPGGLTAFWTFGARTLATNQYSSSLSGSMSALAAAVNKGGTRSLAAGLAAMAAVPYKMAGKLIAGA